MTFRAAPMVDELAVVPVDEGVDGDSDVDVGPDVGGAAGVDAGGLPALVGVDEDGLRVVLDGYEQREIERISALSGEVSEGFASLGSGLVAVQSASDEDAEESGPLAVTLDDSQWSYVRDSLRLQSTMQLFMVCMVAAVLGVILWGLFSGGWRR